MEKKFRIKEEHQDKLEAVKILCKSDLSLGLGYFYETSLVHKRLGRAGVMHWFEEVKERPVNIREIKDRNWYIGASGKIYNGSFTADHHFSSKERAEALLALGQILELRDAWNEGEVSGYKKHFSIERTGEDSYGIKEYIVSYDVLRFKDKETALALLEQFRDLIETAKPVLS